MEQNFNFPLPNRFSIPQDEESTSGARELVDRRIDQDEHQDERITGIPMAPYNPTKRHLQEEDFEEMVYRSQTLNKQQKRTIICNSSLPHAVDPLEPWETQSVEEAKRRPNSSKLCSKEKGIRDTLYVYIKISPMRCESQKEKSITIISKEEHYHCTQLKMIDEKCYVYYCPTGN